MPLKSFFLNLLFPLECLACHQEGSWLCASCFQKLKFNDTNKKYNLFTPNITKVFIAGDYDDPLLATLIKKFKYNFNSSLGPTLALFLIDFWKKIINEQGLIDKKGLINNKDSINGKNPINGQFNFLMAPASSFLIIPIPLSKKRRRWRGFNQAEILAQNFEKTFNYTLNLQLKRNKHQKPQASLNENERAENIKNAFVWSGDNLKDKNIILIDDVVTTGATLNEAAKILKLAGANKIYALVLAKG